MAARILSCLIALTFVFSSTGPLTAAQPPQQPPIGPAAAAYFYGVWAVDSQGQSYLVSDPVGAFNFALTPDAP